MAAPKKVKVALVELTEESGAPSEPYRLLLDVIRSVPDHTDLVEIKFLLIWKYDVKPDVDGNVQAGWIFKLDDVRRAQDQDVEIRLNYEWWHHPNTTHQQRLYCLDDLLSQIRIQEDPETGEQLQDEKGRYVLRKVRHDVHVFSAVESRYTSDVNLAMRGLLRVLALRKRIEAGDRLNLREQLEADGEESDESTVLLN